GLYRRSGIGISTAPCPEGEHAIFGSVQLFICDYIILSSCHSVNVKYVTNYIKLGYPSRYGSFR
ncbi:MAG: hypothetical protein ACPL4H_03975, partial [Anaerolineales bacterium]